MKTNQVFISIIVLGILVNSPVTSQSINWASLNQGNRHLIHLNIGWDYAATAAIGYGYQIQTRLFPIVTNLEYSIPSGSNALDDFKVKLGGQVRIFEYHNFQFSAKIQGVFRRYSNNLVRMINFGSDFSGIAGYYRPRWFVAGEAGFDKAIVTNFSHSDRYLGQYPGVEDGWYEPSTGGNFYYGIQAGLSFKWSDIYFRAGNVLTQDFKTTPLIPMYGQVGTNIKF